MQLTPESVLRAPALVALVLSLTLGGALRVAATTPAGASCSTALGQASLADHDVLGTQLDILSWNIQKSSQPGWAEDLAALTGDIHLAFIQEASLQAGIPGVISPYLYHRFAAGYASATQQTGVMTLSRAAPSGYCNLTAREPWLGTPKATNITEYLIRGRDQRLLAINLHAINFSVGIEEFQAQIHVLEDLLARHRGPVIFAGDFNTWSKRRQLLLDEFLESHALRPVAFTPDNRTRVFGSALDHVYVRGMRARTAEVVEVSSSDHNPLRVRLEII